MEPTDGSIRLTLVNTDNNFRRIVSFASRCTCNLLENTVECLTRCGASSPRSTQASQSHRHVPQVNDSLYLFHKPEGAPDIQILFFHGLQSGQDYSNAHVSTWENHDGSCIWPQTWLVEDFPNAHVLAVSYTKGLKRGSSGTVDMYIIAENLVSDLLQENIGSSCPVVLVGHSIGGLVIKEMCNQAHFMLCSSSEPWTTKLKAFLNGIKGIFYYSTPHHGTPIANRLTDQLGSSLLKYFVMLSRDTERLNSFFDHISKEHYKWLFAALGETLATNLGSFSGIVVPEASARIPRNFNLMEETDHFSICRPRSKILRNFSSLQQFIHRIANELKAEDHEKASSSKPARVPLRFPRDPTYVVLETTMSKVQAALESDTTGPVVTIFGGPGQGKTSMARHLALYYQNGSSPVQSPKAVETKDPSKDLASSRFKDGVVFLPCGPNMDSKVALVKLWEILGYQLPPSMELTQPHASSSHIMQQALIKESFLSNELTRRLSAQQLLIILDDVWEPVIIEKLLFPGRWLKYLVTTKTPQLWSDVRCVQIPLDRPTSEEAYQILTNHVYGRPIDITPPLQEAIHSIVEKADRLPLILANMALCIRGSIQGEGVVESEAWRSVIEHFEDLVKDNDTNSVVVLFNHTYPKSVITCMQMALGSLKEPTRTLLLVASIFDSHPIPIPEVVIKLFFKREHGTLAKFLWCSNHLRSSNFIQIDINHPPWSAISANKSWSLHGMRQTFIEIIQGTEVKSIGDKFLESGKEEDIFIELLLLYGQDQWRDQAAKALGISMSIIQTDSSQPWSSQAAPIKSFVPLLHPHTRKDSWEEKSHHLAVQILRNYIHFHELDDNSLSLLLTMNDTIPQTLEALIQFTTWSLSTPIIPKTICAMVNLLESAENNVARVLSDVTWLLTRLFSESHQNCIQFTSIPHALHRLVELSMNDVGQDVQQWAVSALANLSSNVGIGIKINQLPNIIERLTALLEEGVIEDLQRYAASTLGNLALDFENRIKIVHFPNVIDRIVTLFNENVSDQIQQNAAFALGNLANNIKMVQFPNVIGILAKLLQRDGKEAILEMAAIALGNLASDVENRIQIVQFPDVIKRLVALLADNVNEQVQRYAALALGNLALDAENRIRIVQSPNVIGRFFRLLDKDVSELVRGNVAYALGNLALDVGNSTKIFLFGDVIERLEALLANDVSKHAQRSAAYAIGNLALDVEIRIRMVHFPNVIRCLAGLLAEGVNEDIQGSAALALGNLALHEENRILIVQFPNVIGRLAALLAVDVSEQVQGYAALALGNLALDTENRMEMVQFPDTIGRLVSLLEKDLTEDVQEKVSFALGNLALDSRTRMKIVQFPSVIGRLVILLAEDVSENVQRNAAFALGKLALDVETRVKIAQLPDVIGKLGALLNENVPGHVQRYAAYALANLALAVETRMKMVQLPNVIARLVALLAENASEHVQQNVALAIGNLALDAENRVLIMQFPNVVKKILRVLGVEFSKGLGSGVATALRTLTLEVEGGDFDGALEAYEDGLVAINPRNCFLLSDRCFVKAMRGDFEGALMDINQFIQIGLYRGFGLQERGIVKRMKGDLHGALSDLNDSLGPEPDDYECVKHRGFVKFLLSDENGARADAECALRVKPGSVESYEYGKDLVLGTKSVKFLEYNLT